jgi:hypothetical protein
MKKAGFHPKVKLEIVVCYVEPVVEKRWAAQG